MTDKPAVQLRDELSRVLESARPRLLRVLYHFQIPPEDAEDILQISQLALLSRWDRIQHHEAWLIGTVKKRCILYWRRRKNSAVPAADDKLLELLQEPAATEEVRFDLQAILNSLSPRCRQLLKLRYGLGYGPSEVADILGYHASSIRKVSRRCLSALVRQLLAAGFVKESTASSGLGELLQISSSATKQSSDD